MKKIFWLSLAMLFGSLATPGAETPKSLNAKAQEQLLRHALYGKLTPEKIQKPGVHVNAKTDKQGATALHFAAQNTRNPDNVARLLAHPDININAQLKEGKQTPLHVAAFHKNPEAIKALINAANKLSPKEKAAVINAKDAEGQTPLLYAAAQGSDACIQALLDAGADVTIKDQRGKTALHYAVMIQNDLSPSFLKIINAVSPDKVKEYVNAKDYLGQTPLHYLAKSKSKSAGGANATLLIARGADITATTNRLSQTPLHYAIKGNFDVFATLLHCAGKTPKARKTYIDTPDAYGRTILHEAARLNDYPALGVLVALEKPNINAKDQEGKTPLHYAAENGNAPAIKDLLINPIDLRKIGANVNEIDRYGNTALYYAAKYGKTEAVKTLLAAGANPNLIKDNNLQVIIEQAREPKVGLIQKIINFFKRKPPVRQFTKRAG